MLRLNRSGGAEMQMRREDLQQPMREEKSKAPTPNSGCSPRAQQYLAPSWGSTNVSEWMSGHFLLCKHRREQKQEYSISVCLDKKISQNNKCMFLKIGVLTVHDAEITDTPELHTARWSEDIRVG